MHIHKVILSIAKENKVSLHLTIENAHGMQVYLFLFHSEKTERCALEKHFQFYIWGVGGWGSAAGYPGYKA